MTLTWSSTSNVTYRVEHTSPLEVGWNALVPDIPATNSTASAVHSAATASQQFYRIKVVE